MYHLLIICLCFVPLLAQNANMQSFGIGKSQVVLHSASEYELLNYQVSDTAQHAAITFFWITGDVVNGGLVPVDFALWRFYVDGEDVPSVGPVATSQACLVGDNDPSAPWDNEFFGKNAGTGGWHINVLIPFAKSVRVTIQLPPQFSDSRAFAMVRGVENGPLTIGDVQLPTTARLHTYLKTSTNLAVLGFHELVNVPSGNGYLFATMIDLNSYDNGTLNSLEGCWHAYFPGTQYADWPGLLLGTGAEDYPESAYYFNAGPYRGPTSGLTVFRPSKGVGYSRVAFYKIHSKDTVLFKNGFRFEWRNGDVTDPATGQKCTALKGSPMFKPGVSDVITLVYVYQW